MLPLLLSWGNFYSERKYTIFCMSNTILYLLTIVRILTYIRHFCYVNWRCIYFNKTIPTHQFFPLFIRTSVHKNRICQHFEKKNELEVNACPGSTYQKHLISIIFNRKKNWWPRRIFSVVKFTLNTVALINLARVLHNRQTVIRCRYIRSANMVCGGGGGGIKEAMPTYAPSRCPLSSRITKYKVQLKMEAKVLA